MSRRERFLVAVKGGIPDRIPIFDFLDSQDLFKKIIGRRPEVYNAEDAVYCSAKLGLDAAFIPFEGFMGYSAKKRKNENVYTDEWGTTYRKTKFSWPEDSPVDFPIKSKKDLLTYKVPDLCKSERLKGIKLAVKLNKNFDLAIMGGVVGPLTVAFVLAGWERMSYWLYDDIQTVKSLFKIGCLFFKEAIRYLIMEGADCICIADDLAYKSGLFFSPNLLRRYLFPYLEEMISVAKKGDVPVFFHSDGNIAEILCDLVDMGIDCLNPLQRTAGMSLKKIKEKYGEKISLSGNVDSSITLPFGTPEEVRKQTLECIREAGLGGGYILSSDCDLRDIMPYENIMAMIETGKKYGKYPLTTNDKGNSTIKI